MSNTNWTISGVDHHGNPYHYEGTQTVDDTEPYVWVWVLFAGMVFVGAVIGGLVCTGVIHCCKEAEKKGEYGAGKPTARNEREFDEYIQDRI